MNKQRKVLITTTYNEMGIIIDTKAEEVEQPEKRTETHACDCISRQMVKDILNKNQMPYHVYPYLWDELNKLPPAQLGTNLASLGTDGISRQQAIDALRAMQTYKLFAGDDMILIDQAGAMTELMLLPPAQPETGKWISADAIFGGAPFYCSECGENTRDTVMGKPRWKFCPMCGAKMEVTE